MLGIVLERMDYLEYDQLITFYTREYGMITYMARGIKKIHSKNAAALEPLSFVEFDTMYANERDMITSVYIEEYFSRCRMNMEILMIMRLLSRYMMILLEEGQRDERIFDLLLNFLYFLERSEKIELWHIDAFFLQLFASMGFGMQLERCVVSGKSFESTMKGWEFSYELGGIVAPGVYHKKYTHTHHLKIDNAQIIRMLHELLNFEWEASEGLIYMKEYDRVHSIVLSWMKYYGEKKVYDWKPIFSLHI